MIRNRLCFAVLVLISLLAGGCATYGHVQTACYTLASQGRVDSSLERLEGSALSRRGRDRLLFLMEKGALLHLNGAYRQSNDVLEEADRLFEELFTRSLSAESFSFVTNDTVIPYAGADYEAVYLNYYKILNYLALGEIDEAAVEARRIDEKLGWFGDRYGAGYAASGNAFLRLVTALVYEALGDSNNALVAYRKSLKGYRAGRAGGGPAVPGFLWSRLAASARRLGLSEQAKDYEKEVPESHREGADGGGAVAVIVDNGAIPRKVQIRAVFPSEYGFPVTLALPEFAPGSMGAAEIAVRLDEGRWRHAGQVEDLASVARRSLREKKGRVLAKAVARVAAKQVAARQARNEGGALAGFAAQVMALATEQADLRSWTMLPREVRMAVVPAQPGEHRVLVRAGARYAEYTVRVPAEGVAFVFTRVF